MTFVGLDQDGSISTYNFVTIFPYSNPLKHQNSKRTKSAIIKGKCTISGSEVEMNPLRVEISMIILIREEELFSPKPAKENYWSKSRENQISE